MKRLRFLSLLLPLAVACGGEPSELDPTLRLATREDAVTVPAKGTAATLDFASWNIEWFGDTGNGPSNETLQLENARDVINGADMDIWGVAEIVSLSHWNSLESQLPGYTGFLANESNVIDGAAYYSGFNNTEQKVGILYKSAIATVLDARIILTGSDYDFGGRPPLQVTLRVNLNGTAEDIIVIVLHAKCCTDGTSWQRRANASSALKSYLDATYPTQKVFVIGDFNDDVDTSITSGRASPYANFVNDPARYTFPTQALSLAGISSTISYPDTIDHHLVTNEAQALYIANSVEVYRVDAYISNYGNTTSDHYPVLTRYDWGGGGETTPTLQLTAPNGGESWASGSSQNITWSASNVANVKLEYSLDNGGTWGLITSSTAASAGSYAWTVPGTATSQGRVRVSDASNATLADTSDAAFTITASTTPGNVVLHEILANEAGSNTAGEFIELLNTGGSAVDLSGWTLSDGSRTRHTFASGTSLAAGKALAVFGNASAIPSGLTNAVGASTGDLNLGNSGDTVRLKRADGTQVDAFTYSSSLSKSDGVSMNRSPDGSATGSFVLHNTLSSLKSSAGKRASGADF